MHLVYYDEVKYEFGKQEAHWFGGVVISSKDIASVEEKLNQLAKDVFGTALLSVDTEFHAKDIFHGKKNFKGKPIDERLEILGKLIAISAEPEVNSIYARVRPEPVTFINTPQECEEFTFMCFVERVDSFLKSEKSVGMLIGDYDEPNIGPSVANLSKFREEGTSRLLGREIKQLVDTVHFAKSHHSRLIQLADVDLYCRQFLHGDNTSTHRSKLEKIIKGYSAKRFPKRYKDYPSK